MEINRNIHSSDIILNEKKEYYVSFTISTSQFYGEFINKSNNVHKSISYYFVINSQTENTALEIYFYECYQLLSIV